MSYPITQLVVSCTVVLSLFQTFLQWSIWMGLNKENERPYSQVYLPYFKLMPMGALYFPWTFITAAFTESNPIFAVATAVFLGFSCRYFEQIWGSRSLLKYIALTSVAPVAITWVMYLIGVATIGPFNTGVIGGGTSLYVSFLVAFKQAHPLHNIVLFKGLWRLPVKYLMMPLLIFFTLCGAFVSIQYLWLSWSSLILGWWYLRFVKSIVADSLLPSGESTLLKGDKSDAFAFAKFFYPIYVTQAVAQITNIVFNILVKLGLVKVYDENQVSASNTRVQTTDYNSDRRRALALEMLNSVNS